MMKAENSVKQALRSMEYGMELDIVEIDIQEAYTSLKEILGEVHREDLSECLLEFLFPRKIRRYYVWFGN